MIVYLSLGSNLGNREEYLDSGIRGIAKRGIDVVRCASVYSTEPRDVTDQPWFLNTAVAASTTLPAGELLGACLQVEQENFRVRDKTKGPRTLDVDIIFYGNLVVREPGLVIPHPSFSSRRFVLVPLAEIAAEFTDPVSGRTVGQLLETCTDPATVTLVSGAPVSCRPSPTVPQ